MSPLHRFALAVFLTFACSATPALALGGKHPTTQPIGMLKTDWPAALPEAINSPGRVAGHWVNANDEFFYRGDTRALGEFLRKLAETKLPLTLVLHTTPPRRSLLWGEEPRLAYDWTLLIGTAGWVSPAWKLYFDDPSTRYALRADLWVDGGLAEDAIDLPAGVRLSVERGPVSTTQPATR
ncbi:MAG: hypothetical protein ABIP55_01670 [Tepidisphaeraceae bacterium]